MKRNTFPILACLIIGFQAHSETLDFDQSLARYQAREYAAALPAFIALAELGDHDAQFNAAAMYLRGEGTKKSVADGMAWLALSAEEGNTGHAALFDSLYAKLGAAEKNQVDQRRKALFARYSMASLAKALTPVPADPADVDSRPIKATYRKPPVYPPNAARKGISGWVRLVFAVDQDGHVRQPYVYNSQPAKIFDQSALKAVRKWRFERTGEQRDAWIWATQVLDYKLTGYKLSHKGKRIVAELRSHAERGESRYQFALAELLDSYSDYIVSQQNEITGLLHAAAVNGIPQAQLELSDRLFAGQGCKLDKEKAVRWQDLAAQSGDQVALFKRYLRIGEEQPKAARQSLLSSAAKAYMPAVRTLAWQLATDPSRPEQEVNKALLMFDKVAKVYQNDPDLLDAKAATLARMGNFKAAVKTAERARKFASRNDLNLLDFDAHLTAFQSGNPWRGNLPGASGEAPAG